VANESRNQTHVKYTCIRTRSQYRVVGFGGGIFFALFSVYVVLANHNHHNVGAALTIAMPATTICVVLGIRAASAGSIIVNTDDLKYRSLLQSTTISRMDIKGVSSGPRTQFPSWKSLTQPVLSLRNGTDIWLASFAVPINEYFSDVEAKSDDSKEVEYVPLSQMLTEIGHWSAGEGLKVQLHSDE
jgi:hypothetical protein